MKRFLILLLMLVPAASFAAPSQFGLALRLEHVWTERGDDWGYDEDLTDIAGSVVPSLAVSEYVSLFGRGTYKFGAERSEWAIGVEYRIGDCPKPAPCPKPCTRKHR